MKRFLKYAGIVVLAALTTFCANPEKMAKMASMVKTSCNPKVLECVAGQIKATYSVTFPAKYFLQKAKLKITPVLVYDGGEMVGEDYWLQGDKVNDNYAVVSYANGGTFSRSVVFPYKEGVEKAHLELRATVYNVNKTKSYKYPAAFKIADGTNCTYMLAKTSGDPSFENDNYQKENTITKEAQILYDINKADVKKGRLNSKEIKEFEKFLKEAKADSTKTIESSSIIGYASPDGPEAKNNTLSNERANSAKKAYEKNIAKDARVNVPVELSEKGEDWEGFQQMVQNSNIEDKDLIIRVLSMYSDPAVREREIRNMSNVFQTLKSKVLPQLRRSRMVANVVKKNFSDDQLKQMVKNNDDRLDEEALLYSATLTKNRKEKAEIYQKAADKYNSSRAYNNLAAMALQEGKTNDAENYLSKMSEQTPSYYNNMGVVELQKKNYDKASEYFAKANSSESKENQGAIDILNGNYAKAAQELEGTKCYNNGLAKILNNDLDGAQSVLKDEKCPNQSYLRAIVAARKGDATTCENELAKAYKMKKYEQRAEKDIEFAAMR
ncbi:MAG: hypothetical protein LKM37_02640 [Bacteroidales bacterium]|jgi:outer membrane protein OmpA-like peptidoglycan-associated protein|nr:hypothetical protein [Bacteroidales bacterium]MCI1732896.1 hypothetical protein [Bacteroidales bacterium]